MIDYISECNNALKEAKKAINRITLVAVITLAMLGVYANLIIIKKNEQINRLEIQLNNKEEQRYEIERKLKILENNEV